MTDSIYDNGLAPYIGGYPSALVDRGIEIDPSDFEQYFLQKIIIPVSSTISNGAEQTGSTTLDVSLTVDVESSINGNWSLACVLVEDSVTGIGGSWYQRNYYGQNAITLIDVDGTDWGTLPDWVLDVDMVYRHVARAISPSFNGDPLDNSSYTSGDQFTKCFQFTLDPTWDLTQMHIVGMLLNPNGEIDNASSTSISTSIANGYESCNSTSISNELIGPDQKLTIYPNPAVSTTTLLITLDTEKEVSISVKSIEGKLIAKGEYGTMIGSHSLTFDVSDFANGVYIIEAIIGNEVIVKKFIKE